MSDTNVIPQSIPLSTPLNTLIAQEQAVICCGENTPCLYTVDPSNWIAVRNKFLGNVQYNGARSHQAIIDVLVWFSQFNVEYDL